MRLADEVVQRIDGILAAAQAQGRATLYEHEVYGILQAIGLGVPRHRFVRDVLGVTPEVLAGVGHTAMVKVVSPGIPHKQKLGGVKRVATTDPLYVQFVLTRMREEVLSHFAPGEAPEIAGFLLVEYVPHTAGARLRGPGRVSRRPGLRAGSHGQQGRRRRRVLRDTLRPGQPVLAAHGVRRRARVHALAPHPPQIRRRSGTRSIWSCMARAIAAHEHAGRPRTRPSRRGPGSSSHRLRGEPLRHRAGTAGSWHWTGWPSSGLASEADVWARRARR
ncbi:MAG: acetate--CoA ligase family protein [Candidatus Moduliflexus flocculans]|nr:acetate--CoA ligase family protein [Candidatus Moduliflexus flocculans]